MSNEVGEITGLPLSKFAMAELVARAHKAGCPTLWDYVATLEHIAENPFELLEMPSCSDPYHDELGEYVRHHDDCMKPVTGLCSCGLDQVLR